MGRKLETIKVRADFLRVAGVGHRSSGPSLVVQAAPSPGQFRSAGRTRVGYTASRKVGNAVIRNRAKRRMRAAARVVLPTHGLPGMDYVLIARASTANRPFSDLLVDLEAALSRIERTGRRRAAASSPDE